MICPLVVIASRSSLILADMLLICITWTALYKRSDALPQRHSLSYILLRDGQCVFDGKMTLTSLIHDGTGSVYFM